MTKKIIFQNKLFRRSAMLFAATLLISTCFTGCGKSEKDELRDELKEAYSLSDDEADELAGYLSGEGNGDDSEGADTGAENAMESETEAPTVQETYEKSPEWDSQTAIGQFFQIDDTVYVGDVLMSETMDKVAASEVGYTYEYNENKLIPAGSCESITIRRNDIHWFYIQAWNPTEDTLKLADCITSGFSITKEAKPSCRFLDGRSYDEILSLTYDDVKSMTDIFPEPAFSVRENPSNNAIRVIYSNDYPNALCHNEDYMENFIVYVYSTYCFDVNTDTGMVYNLDVVMHADSWAKDLW